MGNCYYDDKDVHRQAFCLKCKSHVTHDKVDDKVLACALYGSRGGCKRQSRLAKLTARAPSKRLLLSLCKNWVLISLSILMFVTYASGEVQAQTPIEISNKVKYFELNSKNLNYYPHKEPVDFQMDRDKYLAFDSVEEKKAYLEDAFDRAYAAAHVPTLEEIIKLQMHAKFMPFPTEKIQLGRINHAVWYHIKLSSKEEIRSKIFSITGRSGDFKIFFLDQDFKLFKSFRAGLIYPYQTREVLEPGKELAFPFDWPHQASNVNIFIQAYTNPGISHTLAFRVYDPEHYHSEKKNWVMIQAIYGGAIISLMLYNLAIFFISREKMYIYYVCYVGATFIAVMQDSAINVLYLQENIAVYRDLLTIAGICGLELAFVLFLQEFLSLKLYKRINFAAGIFRWIFLINFILCFFIPFQLAITIASITGLIGIPLVTIITFYLAYLKKIEAYFFLLAFLAFFATTIIVLLGISGVMSSNILTENGLQIGSFLEVSLLSVAMGYKLKTLSNSLEKLNATLETKVEQKTRHIRSILKNIQQGIFTIKRDETVHHEYSEFCEKIMVGKKIAGSTLKELLQDSDIPLDELAIMSSIISGAVGESELNWLLNSHLLPRQMSFREKIIECDWIPILNDEQEIEQILVSFRDVTDLRELEKKSLDQKRQFGIISQIIEIPATKFDSFLQTSDRLLEENKKIIYSRSIDSPDQIKSMFINLHTLKGNARSLGLTSITSEIHQAEEFYSKCLNDFRQWDWEEPMRGINAIEKTLKEYKQICAEKLNRQLGKTVVFDRNDVGLWIKSKSKKEAWQALKNAYYCSATKTFAEIFSEIASLAKELNKAEPNIILQNENNVYFSPEGVEFVKNSFVHIVSNSLDHGIEEIEERIAKGKASKGTIIIEFRQEEDTLAIFVSDDGKGLNLTKLIELGKSKKLLNEDFTNHDVAQLIFHSGISTAKTLSDISGRGMGMAAIKDFTEKSGGTITVELDSNIISTSYSFRIAIRVPTSIYEIM